MTESGDAVDPGPHETWTIQRILEWTRDWFGKKGIDSPRLDAELLLADVLGRERIYLYTHFDQPLSAEERAAFRERVKRRAAREPVAYILGEKEFYSRPFGVTGDVLIPRPETEHLVELALDWVKETGREDPRILDMGTGSGCIAITLAAQLPSAMVTATDVSAAALAVATGNAERNGVADRVAFFEGDCWDAVPSEATFDVVLTNPPYIKDGEKPDLAPEITEFEPPGALFAGDDGLTVVRRIVDGLPSHLASPGVFACELDPAQAPLVEELLAGVGLAGTSRYQDLAGHDRGVVVSR